MDTSKKMTITSLLLLAALLQLAISGSVFGQETNPSGLDNNPILNENEAELLNNYFIESRGTFDFKDKKVVFVSGSTGKTYITKRDYFEDVKKWNEANSRMSTTLIILTAKEKRESGDYDALLTAWVKVLTPKRRSRIMKELGAVK